MRIAIFTDSFLPGVGGTEKAVLGLAEELSKNNKVAVCCPRYNKKYKDDFVFKVFRTKSMKLTKNDYFAFPSLTKSFVKKLNEFKPEIIHCQSVSPMTSYALKYAKKNNIPVLITVHTKFKMAFEKSIKVKFIVNKLIKDLVQKLNKANKVCTVSNDMISELRSYGYNGDVEVVRNGAMFEKITNLESLRKKAEEKYFLKNTKHIFLYVGHVVKFKNLEFTFNALKIVKEKIPDFKMLVVGSGLDDEYFKKFVDKSGIKDNVIFTGQITDKEILSSLYSVGQLFLFPSIFDNDPLTIVEAALHHVPAITLENTGSSERIENEVSGFIVKDDVNEFAQKIVELCNNKSKLKTVGDNAEKLIPKRWDKTADEYFDIYKSLV